MSRQLAAVLGMAVVASLAIAVPRFGVARKALEWHASGTVISSGSFSALNFVGENVSCSLANTGDIASCVWTTNPAPISGTQPVLFSQGDGGLGTAAQVFVSDGGNGGRVLLTVNTIANGWANAPDAGSSSDIVLGTTNRANYAQLAIARVGELSSTQEALWQSAITAQVPAWVGIGSPYGWGAAWSNQGSSTPLNGPDAGNPDGGTSATYRFAHRHFNVQSTGAINTTAQIYQSNPPSLVRGDGTYGGFTCIMDFSVDYATGSAGFVGLTATTGNLAGTLDPTALANAWGVGWASSSTSSTGLSIVTNGPASSNLTVCGGSYAVGYNMNVYRLTLNARQNSAGVLQSAELRRLDDATVTPCIYPTPATYQIAGTTMLLPRMDAVNLSASTAVGLNSYGIWCQGDPG